MQNNNNTTNNNKVILKIAYSLHARNILLPPRLLYKVSSVRHQKVATTSFIFLHMTRLRDFFKFITFCKKKSDNSNLTALDRINVSQKNFFSKVISVFIGTGENHIICSGCEIFNIFITVSCLNHSTLHQAVLIVPCSSV